MNPAAHPSSTEEQVIRLLERAAAELRPDALYRRRLRAEVVNRHVATREGLIARPRTGPRREMGKLGRAVLYASLGTALSVTAVGAAAQDSVPGDPLYTVKLQLEELRLRIASPALRYDLLVMALDERIEEIAALADRGDWHGAASAAAAVEATEKRLEGAGAALGHDAGHLSQDGHQVEVLTQLLAEAPASARNGLERALEAVTEANPPGAPRERPTRQGGRGASDGTHEEDLAPAAANDDDADVPPRTTDATDDEQD